MRNVILFLILGALLVFTYFFEEKGYIAQNAKQEEMKQLFDKDTLGELLKIKTSNSRLYKKNGVFYTEGDNYPVDAKALEKFFEVLSGIRVQNILEEKELAKEGKSKFISDQSLKLVFNFTGGELIFVLGDRLEFENSFYMQIASSNKLMIAYDSSSLEEVYEKGRQTTHNKYDRLKQLFLLDDGYFKDRRIFKIKDFITKDDVVSISNIRNKDFKILLKDLSTTPFILDGLKYKQERFQRFLLNLQNLTALEIFSDTKSMHLTEKIAEISINSTTDYTLELFRKYGSMNGYFIKTNFDTFIYEINTMVNELFFSNVQDFWRKIVFAHCPNIDTSKMSISFPKRKKVDFRVPNNGVKQLLDFFCLKEADYVVEREKKEKNGFFLTIDNQEFYIIYKNGEIIINDLKKSYEYHYFVGDIKPFGLVWEDYFH